MTHLKVLLVAPRTHPNLRYFLSHLIQSGFEVSILVDHVSADFEAPPGLKILRVTASEDWETQGNSFDIVIYRHFSYRTRMAARLLRKPRSLELVYDQHPIGSSMLQRMVQIAALSVRLLQRRPLIRISPRLRRLKDSGWNDKYNYHFKHPGPNLTIPQPQTQKKPHGEMRILFVGKRYVRRKSLALAIMALEKMMHGAELEVVSSDGAHTGTKKPGFWSRRYDFRVNQMMTAAKKPIRYRENLSRMEMVSAYMRSDVLLLPSRREPFSISNVEAASLGVRSLIRKSNGSFLNMPRGSVVGLKFPVTAQSIADELDRLASMPGSDEPERLRRSYAEWSSAGPWISDVIKKLWETKNSSASAKVKRYSEG